MKKLRIIPILLIILLVFSSCSLTINKDSSEKSEQSSSDVSDKNSSKEVKESSSEVAESKNVALDPTADKFVKALTSKNKVTLKELTYVTDDKALSYVDNVTFSSIKATDVKKNSNKFEYTLELNVSESKTDLFPTGKSTWKLVIFNDENAGPVGVPYVYYFGNVKNEKTLYSSVGKDYLHFCVECTKHFGKAETYNSISSYLSKDVTDSNYMNIYEIYNLTQKSHDAANVKPADLKQFAKARFGIENADFTKWRSYNKSTDSFEWGRGTYFPFASVSSDKLGSDNVRTITMDYYADSMLLVKAYSIEYKLAWKSDSDYKIISATLNDKGIEAAKYSMG